MSIIEKWSSHLLLKLRKGTTYIPVNILEMDDQRVQLHGKIKGIGTL